MTGPAEGKIPITARLIINGDEIPCDFYIHLKGYSRARVTHLDIEGFQAQSQDKIIGCRAVGTSDGFTVILFNYLIIANQRVRKLIIRGLRILEEGLSAKCVVGVKGGGIFIGFESKVIPKLESIASALLS